MKIFTLAPMPEKILNGKSIRLIARMKKGLHAGIQKDKIMSPLQYVFKGKLSRGLVLSLFATVGLFLVPWFTNAQITQPTVWTNIYNVATGTVSGNTFPIAGGSNRILVVGITTVHTSSATVQDPGTISYGGVALTKAVGDGTTSGRMHTWLYYLKDNAIMNGANQPLNITMGTASQTITNLTVWYTVFAGVDLTPASYTTGNNLNNNAPSGPALLSAAMAVNTNAQAVYISSIYNDNSTAIPAYTINANWTTGGNTTGSNSGSGIAWKNEVAKRAIPVSNVTDNAVTSAITPANNARFAMSAISLPKALVTYTSITNGAWSTPGTWDLGSVPVAGSNVVIANGTSVNLTANTNTINALTVNGNLDVSTFTLTGAATNTVSGTGTLFVGGATNFPTGFTATTLSSGSTVNYNAAGAQTVSNQTYSNLTLSNSGAKTLQTGTTSITGSLTLSGTATTATVVGLNIGGNLNIGDGTVFTAAGFALTVTGTTTVGNGTNGTFNITSATGAKLFTGLVTINTGGAWNNTAANSPVTFRGGITNNGTFNAGTAINTFDTNAQQLNGTLAIPNMTVTGVTVTNNNTLTVSTALSGTGGVTQAANATLNIGGTSGITTLTAANSGNTVNYTGAAQTVHGNNYTNLILSGSGAKTLPTGTTSITGSLTLSGTATTATVVGLNIGGDLSIGDGTTFTAAGFPLTVTGATNVGGGANGTLVISSATGTKIFTGLVTINTGGIWNNSGNSPVTFRGGITNNGTFTAGTGVHTFDTNAQALSGNAFTIPSVTVTGAALTNNNSLTVNTALSGTGSLTQAASATLNIGAASGIASINATAAGNNVFYTATTGGQTLIGGTYNNVTLNNTSGTNTANGNVVVNGTMIANGGAGGTLSMSTFTLSGSAITNNGTISTQNTSATPLPSGASWGGTINYNAITGAQTVVTGTYTNLTSGNTSGINTAAGNLTINGALTTTALGTLSLGTNMISGTLATIINNGTISTANTSATPLPSGLTWGGTINYNALTGGQTVVLGTYNNLTLGNTSGVTTTEGNLVVNGTLTTTASGTLDMGTNVLSGTLSAVVNNGTISTANTGTTPLPSGKTWGGVLIYAGAAPQTIVAGTYGNLTISNTAGTSLGGAVAVNTALNLSSSLPLDANHLTLGFAGAVGGISSSVYIVTNSTGQLKRTVGGTAVSFPVGNSAYNPLTLTNSGTADVYGVVVVDGSVVTAIDPGLTVDRRWQVTEAVAGGSNLAVVAQYNTGETTADFTNGNPILGFYNGTSWMKSTATYNGGPAPFTFTSTTNFTPANLTTGTQYFALGKDYAFVAGPTQFVITAIVPNPVISGAGFQVTIQSQNASNETSNVTTQTFFNLSTNGNAGPLSGTVSGSIPAGQSSVTLNGVILSALGSGVTITATLDVTNGGDALTPGTSAPFNVVASAISDIITANNETPNIDYKSKTGSVINTTSDGIRVWSFNVRDGGGSADADNLATVLSAVTISKGGSNTVTSWANTIQEAALFDGATKVAEITVAGETLVFSSLNGGTGVSVADNSSKTLDLYLTFKTANITDGQRFQFAISNATASADPAGSLFSAFTAFNSSVTGTNNRIQVTASQLVFGAQALTDVAVSAAMTPAFTIRGVDINNNLDLDYTSAITLAVTGSTFFGAAPSTAAVAGVATFSPVFASTGTGVTITGSDGVITATPPSNTFNVTNLVPVVTDLFRSKTTGDWDQLTTWQESHDGSSWFDAAVTPTNANSSSITILNGHTVTIPASLPALSVDQTTISVGGQLTVGSGVTLTLNDGTGTDLTASGILSVNGTVVNQPTSSIAGTAATLLFNANGTYEHNQNGGALISATWNINSTCKITGFTNGGTNALTNLGQAFGNFVWDCSGQTTALVQLQNNGFTGCAGTMTVNRTGSGSIYITSNSTTAITVGNYAQTGGTVVILNTSFTTRTFTVTGSFTLNQNTTTSSFQLSSSSPNISGVTLNVGGNFSIAAGAFSTAGSNITTTVNFNGTGTRLYSKTGGTISGNIDFNILSNATLDFGTSLLDGSSGDFSLNSGGGIITAHAQGLSTSGGTGSIQVTGSKAYNNAANYTYNGAVAQVTGNGLATANNLTINNTAGVTLTGATTVNGALTLTNGLLILGANNLTIGASGSISGASSVNYIQTNNTGLLRRTVAASAVLFPVGNAAYNPITLTNSGTSDVYGITEIDGSVPSALDATFAVNRRWRITENNSGASNLAVVGQYNSGEEAANFASGSIPKIGFYNGTVWVENKATQAGANPFTFTSLTNFTPTNLTTGTQYFALGKDQAFVPLPQGSLTGNQVCVTGTGQLTFTATSGTSPFTIVYNDGTNNVTQTNVISGTPFNVSPNPAVNTNYTLVSITDADGDVRSSGFTGGTATITIHPAIVNNTIAADQSVCSGSVPAPLTGSLPTGGNDTYAYLWQSSTTNATSGFANAAGTNNGQNYTPTATITQTTWFRRVVTSNGCSDNGNAIQVTVTPAPTITPGPALTASQSCSPAAITLTGASFGAPATSAAWSIVSGGGTLSTTALTASPATVTYTPASGFTGTVTLALTTDVCPLLSASRTITVSVPTIVNYNFNTGASFGALVSNAVPNITATAGGSNFATSATGVVTGGQAFTVNSTAGNSLSQTATANNNWTFSLTGADVRFYKTFKVYFEGQRNSGTTPQNINVLYSIDGGANYIALGNTPLNNTGTWVEGLYSLPVGADNPTSLAIKLNITSGTGTTLIDNVQIQGVYTLPADRTPVAAASPICQNASTNIQIPTSQLGVNYQLRNNTGNINIGSPVAGTGSTINLPTGNLSTATTFNVLASNSCSVQMVNTVTVNVNAFATLSSNLTPPAVCTNTPFNYTPTSATSGTTFNWSRAVVAGISNSTASGAGDPNETLINTTANPVNVTYQYTLTANGCTNPAAFSVVVVVNPSPALSSTLTPPAVCDGNPFQYIPTSATAGATFNWSRAVVDGISNPAASGTDDPNETLFNITMAPVNVTYVYTLSANGCNNPTGYNVIATIDPSPSAIATDTVVSNSTGVCGALITLGGNVVTNGTLSYMVDGSPITNPYTFPIGTTNVTVIAENNCGTSTTFFDVTVNDTEAPVAPVLADVTGECSATAPVATTTDNCAGTVTGTTSDPLTYTTQGTFVIHWSFDDGHGNVSTANQNVVVHDVTAPAAPVLADVTGECTATATAPTATDNCTGVITGTTSDELTYSTQGTHVIHWSFNDGHGNISTANQNVVIDDVTAPDAPVLADVTGECSATATAPTATDNCAGTITGTTSDELTYSTQGTHVIHWSFDDGNGNISTANQNVIIHDVTPPAVPSLADVTDECAATATAPTTTDLCAGTITGTTLDALTYTTQGTHVIHWSFDDGNGNISFANQNVIIHDITAPVEPVLTDVTGECSVTATTPTTTDNCAGTVTGTTSDALTYTTQGTHVIHWSFDDGHGNVTTVNQNVVINDVTAPDAPALADVTGECDATATAPTTTDNCAGIITGTTSDALTYSTQGTHVIHWSFDDGHGNVTTANQNVVIDDVTAPDAPTLGDVTGECGATATAPTTTDNCAGTVTGTTSDELTYTTQGTHVIHWSFDDGHGNVITANQNVVIDDVTAPDVPELADVTGECSATATAPTTTDNCAGTITGTTGDALTYTTQGTHVIHWSFDDGNGNISTANQSVVVHDGTAPAAPTLADVTGECSATATAPTTIDNCVGTVTGTTSDALTYTTQGTHVIHWSFNDGHGNISTANQNVIINDVTAPDVPELADVTGECGATATAPTTIDNCAGTITGTTLDALTYTTQGTHVIHWSFNDGHGNISTANQNVIIDDVTAPDAPALADVTGECSATATAPTTTDNCAGTITGTTSDALTYTTSGTHVIHWSFDDGNGNISTANQNVIINDITPPVTPTLADVTGECSATATAPTTTDNCAGIVTGTTSDALTYTTQGTHVIHWSFDDGHGNISTANQNVIIDDVTAPDAPALADVTGECSATATAPTTTDNCVGTVTGTTSDALTYTTQGTHVIHWSFDDGNGNISTANQNVVIDDVTAPATPALADVTGECSATATAPTTTDNCSGTITGTTSDALTYTTQGTHVIHWSFDDGNGNISTANQNVVIDDVTAPATPTLADVTGECSATATAPTTTDNCSGTITGTTPDALTYTAQGTHVIHWSFDDGNGNISTANQNVIIDDVTAPAVPALADVTGECSATATAPTTTDNCSGTITGTTTDLLTYSTGGTHVIHWSFDDGNGNISTANQNVIINDITAPDVPELADVTGECSATATAPTTTDNCAGTVTGTTSDALTYTTQGTHVIHWSFDDGHGNISTANQNVIIDDITAPATPVLADVTGECSATATAPTTTDNCVATITGTTGDPLTYTTSGTHVIHWSFDDGHGNISTANQNVIINDVTPPVMPTLADLTGECTITAVAPTTTDNCAGTVTGTTSDALTYSTEGTHVIHWSFDDGHGNITTANQNVIINDITAPAIPVLADVTGECSATATAPTTTDNCVGSVTGTTSDALTYSTQGTHVIHWSFDDGNGNVSNANQNVIINDITPPATPALADVTGECTATATTPSTTDNCSGTITGTTTDLLTYSTQGTHVIHWSFDDGHGNITTANQNVIIDDVTAPAAPTLADVTGECTATATAPTTTDNCAGTITGTTSDALTYTTQGTHVIHWSFNDGNGNISTANQNVIIDDNTAPVVPVLGNLTNQCTVTAVAPTTTDNCAGTITGTTTDPLTYSTEGTFVIHWSFNDGNGNISTANQNVIIDDITAPVVPVLANLTGQCTVTAVAPTTTDNCAGTVTGTTSDPLTYSTEGNFVIHWSFDDGHGNISTANQNVVIDDITAPVVPVLANVTGECSATATAPTTTDNCSGTITGTTGDPLTYSTQGTFVIHWSFDDGHGNVSTANQNVVVDDITAPVVPVLANVTGECSATATPPTTTDNCAGTITGTTSDPLTYTTQGTFVIHWSFNDGNGNISTANQNVIIHDLTGPTVTTAAGSLNATLECDDADGITQALSLAPAASDNCGGTPVIHLISNVTTPDPLCANGYTQVRTWNFTDADNNASSNFVQTITVQDHTPPFVVQMPADVTVNADANCQATGVNLGILSALDNCSGTVTITNNHPSIYPIGITNVTWTIKDPCNNTITRVQTVRVVDHTNPVIANCPSDITVFTGAGALTCNKGVSWTPPSASDNCGSIASFTSNYTPGAVFPVGTTLVTYVATDASTNSSICSFNVNVIDNTVPVINNCPANIVTCNPAVSWTAPTATDNCGVTTFTNDAPASFTVGVTTVTYTAKDATGNTTTCSFTVTLNPQPMAIAASNSPICAGNTLSLSAAGGTSYSWSGPNGFSSTQQNPSIAFATTAATGTYTVIVSNASGCTATATTNVVVGAGATASASSNSPVCAGGSLNLTASGGVSYSWSGPNGYVSLQQNPTISNITTAGGGIYTVTVTNAAGCTAQAFVSVTVSAAINALATNSGPVCEGTTLSLSAAGGSSYSWSGPNGFGSTQQNPSISNATMAASGTYTVTVTGSSGCSATTSTNVTVSAMPTALIASNSPVCQGGSLNLSAGGGASYAWTGPNGFSSAQQNPVISNATPATAGFYTVTVTNAAGCSASATTQVNVTAGAPASAASNSPVCTGGTLTLFASSGASYLWSGPNGFSSLQQNPTLSGITTAVSGIYTVTVTNASGCTSVASTNVVVGSTPIANASSNSPICAGSQLNLSASGGASYSWSGPNGFSSTQQNPNIPNATAAAGGVYTVTVTNAAGCTATTTVNVTVNAALTANASSNSPVCAGNALNLFASGGVSYVWSGPNGFSSTQQNPTIANATAAAGGTYTVTVTGASGCTATITTSVTVNAALVANASSNSPVCAGTALNLFASGGVSYSWSGPNDFVSTQQNPVISNATAAAGGTYTVTVTNAAGCTVTITTNVTINAAVTASASSNSPVCTGNAVNLFASGGVSYSWSGPNGFSSTQQNPTISNATVAAGGIYTVTVTNAGGCTATTTTSVTVNTAVVATASSNSPVCAGNTLNLFASGGVSYSWTGPNGFSSTQQNPSIADATAAIGGTYTVTITNAAGCVATTTTNVTVNATLVATASSNSPVCAGSALNLSASGGVSYSWSGPNSFSSTQQNPVISNATAAAGGTYSVTVTNAAGCTATTTVIVTINGAVSASASSNSPVCAGNALNLFASGGVSYVWSGPNGFSSTQQNPTIANAAIAAGGTYTVTVTSATGCTATLTTNVTVNAALVANASSNSPVCAGNAVNLSASGGVSYSWSGPNGFASTQQNPTISNATAAAGGTYTVIVTNAGGCTATVTTNVIINAAAVASASSNSPVCAGNALNLFASGGVSYSWSGPNGFASTQQNPTISNATAAAGGTYTVTVTNAGGCTSTTTTSVTISAAVIASASSNSPVCAGTTLNLSASGGVSYSWSGPNGFASAQQNPGISSATAAASGTYTVTITNAAGCTATTTTDVTVNAALTATASSNSPVCAGASVNLFVSSGASYSWTGPNGFASTQQNPVIANATTAASGTYTVAVTNAGGCTATTTTNVTVNAGVVATASSNSPLCAGVGLSLFSSGGVSYSWSGPNGFASTQQNPTISNATTAASGIYSVIVTNANGCTATATTNVTVNAGVVASASSNSPVCAGNALNLFVSGGVFYSWSGPNGFSSTQQNPVISNATTTASGTYTVTVTNAAGCTATVTTSVNVNTTVVASASSNSPVCAGSSLSLFANGGTSYSWTGPNGFLSSQQNPTISNATLAAGGTYTVTVSNGAGCTATTTTNVTVNGAVSASASSNSPVCAGTSLNLFASGGVSYNWSGPNGFSSTQQNPTILGATAAASGIYTVTVANAAGCTATTTTSITVNTGVVATASSNSPVCTGSNLTLFAGGGISYSWSGPNGFLSTLQNPVISGATAAASGIYAVSVTGAGGCTASTTTTITVNAGSVGGSVSGSTAVCSGSNGGTLSLSAQVGAVIRWESSTDGGGNWSPISNTTTSLGYANLTLATQYRAVVQVGSCTPANSGVATITMNPASVGGSVSGTTSACSGSNSGTMTLSGQTGSVIRWESSIDNGVNWSTIGNTTTTQSYTNLTQTTQYRAVVQSGTCTSANAVPATITVNLSSVGGTVSGSTSVCTGSNSGTVSLSGYGGTIMKWQFSINGGGNWTDIINTTTSQSYSNLTTTTLYRAVIGGCSTSNSTAATITVTSASVGGSVSGSTAACSGSNGGTLTLSGQTGAVTKWESSIDGGVNWSTIGNTTTTQTYTNLTQTTQYRAVVLSGSCTSANSSVATITINAGPVGGTVSGSTTVCSGSNNGTVTLSGYSGSISKWQFSINGGGNWTDIANTTTTQSYTNLTQTTLYRAVISGCATTANSGAATITMGLAPPVVTITASDAANEFCNGLTLTANSSVTAQSYLWSTSATTQTVKLGTANPAGNYSVVVTGTNGCTGSASYAYNPQAGAGSYTILATYSVDLNRNNNVQSGSVGVTGSNGTISIAANSSVASSGAFVKAKNLNINASANVPTKILSPVVATLPTMQFNTTSTSALSNVTVANNSTGTLNGNYKNVTVGTNCNVTLTGSIFGVITIKAGSKVRFTQAVVNIAGVDFTAGTVAAPTTLAFSQNTTVKSIGDINVASLCKINPEGYKVVFYLGMPSSNSNVDFKVATGGNITVNASVYSPNGSVTVGGNATNDTYMTGKFVGVMVTSAGQRVIWNSFDCSAANLITRADVSSQVITPTVDDVSSAMKVTVTPMPTETFFTLRVQSTSKEEVKIKVYDVVGRQIEQFNGGVDQAFRFGAGYMQGTYIVEVHQGKNVKVMQIIKI